MSDSKNSKVQNLSAAKKASKDGKVPDGKKATPATSEVAGQALKKLKKTENTEKKSTKATAVVQQDADKISGFPSKVVDLVGRTGVRGEIVQVRCEVLEGRDSGKVLIRNVKSPVKAGDILLLSETAMQARKLEARR